MLDARPVIFLGPEATPLRSLAGKHCSASIAYSVSGKPALFARRYFGYLNSIKLINNHASSIILVSLRATVERLPSQRPYKTSESSIRGTPRLIARNTSPLKNRHFLSVKMEWEWAERAFATKPSVASCIYIGSQCSFPPPSATWLRSLVPACCAPLTCY